MIEQPSRTLVCSIVFLDIVDYSTKPVAEQLLLKQAFNKLLSSALDNVHARDRVVLDTGDGAAITFLGDPEDALFVAMSLRAAARAEATGAIAIRVGINLGPVRVVKDINGQMNIIGDGINVAQRVMSFSQSGQLLVSRSFYEVVSCLSLDYASLFSYVGARTDKHVREHEVYSVGIGTEAAQRVLATGSQRVAPRRAAPRLIGELTDARPFGIHRVALLSASLMFALMVGGGVAVRAQVKPLEAAPGPVAKKAAPAVRAEKPAAAAQTEAAAKAEVLAKAADAEIRTAAPTEAEALVAPRAKSANPAPRKTLSNTAPAQVAVAAMSSIEFAILPWGEVFVDGKRRGVSPPLRRIEISPGPHAIEIRNTSFPSYIQQIEAQSGKPVNVKHRFR
jgi:class 3 adenylate cyclase